MTSFFSKKNFHWLGVQDWLTDLCAGAQVLGDNALFCMRKRKVTFKQPRSKRGKLEEVETQGTLDKFIDLDIPNLKYVISQRVYTKI